MCWWSKNQIDFFLLFLLSLLVQIIINFYHHQTALKNSTFYEGGVHIIPLFEWLPKKKFTSKMKCRSRSHQFVGLVVFSMFKFKIRFSTEAKKMRIVQHRFHSTPQSTFIENLIFLAFLIVFIWFSHDKNKLNFNTENEFNVLFHSVWNTITLRAGD